MLLAHPRALAFLVIALAFVLRVAEVQRAPYTPAGNARAYLVLGGQIARHGDYASARGVGGSRGPTAYFAPVYPYLLGALDFIDGNRPASAGAVHVARLCQAVLGTIVVGLIGLIALEMFGIDMALLAMALAAIYPVMIALSSVLVAENLMVVFVLAAVWTALRVQRTADPLRWIAATGVLTGLAALTHASAILLLIPLAVAVSRSTPVFGRRRVGAIGVLLVTTLITLTPWLVRDGLVMHRFVPITDESGITLAGTYNATSAHQNPPYRWSFYSTLPDYRVIARHASQMSETQLESKLRSRAVTYVTNHPVAPASAAWHNTLRLLQLDGTRAWKASAESIGLKDGTARIGMICFWVLCGLAVLGLVAPPGLRAPGWLWAVPLVMWLSVVLVNAETPRLRAIIDPFLILLAARGVARVAGWMRSKPSVAIGAAQVG